MFDICMSCLPVASYTSNILFIFMCLWYAIPFKLFLWGTINNVLPEGEQIYWRRAEMFHLNHWGQQYFLQSVFGCSTILTI